MKKTISSMILLVLILAGCASKTPADSNSPSAPIQKPQGLIALPAQTQAAGDLSPAERAAFASLSQTLGLPPEQITLTSSDAVTWPNGCLGIQRIGLMCTQNEVPGFRIVLGANGRQYEFHTNQDGSMIVPVEAMQAPGPAQDAMVKQLATNLEISESDISFVSSTAIQWPDSCLGEALEGVACAEVVTPGYLIVLEAGGRQYEYHANDDGTRFVPGTLALNWSRKGGASNVCESLTIFASGEVYGYSCRPNADERVDTLMNLASADERRQFYGWLDKYGETTIDLSDTAGGLTRGADLYGLGSAEPNKQEQQAIFDLAQKVYQQLYK